MRRLGGPALVEEEFQSVHGGGLDIKYGVRRQFKGLRLLLFSLRR